MTSKPILGTLVKYTADFVRNAGGHANLPKNGRVTDTETSLGDHFVYVHWCDRDMPVLVDIAHIMPAEAPDRS